MMTPEKISSKGGPPIGATYEVVYPFVHGTFEEFGENGTETKPTWRPGLIAEPDGPDSFREICHAHGTQFLTVVSVHKPGRYPTRVFFTQRFRDPDGKSFGKSKLRMTTTAAFRRLCAGFRVPYSIEMLTPTNSRSTG